MSCHLCSLVCCLSSSYVVSFLFLCGVTPWMLSYMVSLHVISIILLSLSFTSYPQIFSSHPRFFLHLLLSLSLCVHCHLHPIRVLMHCNRVTQVMSFPCEVVIQTKYMTLTFNWVNVVPNYYF